MAQDENGIPVGDDNIKRKTADFLPRYFRTVANKKFLSSTIDQMMQPGVVEKVDGFIGRKDAKAWSSSDNYVSDVSADRENYQLEPVAVVEDTLGNTILHRDYRDYMNSAKIRNAQVGNHSLTNSQEFYSWDPHINWDKFTNFREYYWLPQGPDSIPVFGAARDIKSTYNVNSLDNVDNFAYSFNTTNPTANPTLTLYRGQTYVFDLNTVDMPFTIRTSRSLSNDTNLYNTGVSEQKVETGTVTFEVDLEAPDYLYYINNNDIEASGLIIIKDIRDNTQLDVGSDIVGKKTYTMQNGYEMTNGMKVKFYGEITPAEYAIGNWYVEGVGESIRLVSEDDVLITADYLLDNATEFDEQGFSTLPFDNATSYASEKDYIVINRASPDNNQWSRYNRWTHRSVIETTATINNVPVMLDQTFRAVRPIIEFEAGLKLYNSGTFAKQSVDLVDTRTTDVFSQIEGQVGYFVDGVELVSGMRVLFTADPDSLVSGKIYEVNFISHNGSTQITLVETTDTAPLENETVLVKAGTNFKGKMFYYDGTDWKQSQDKTGVNQQPLFDLYNDEGTALSDLDGSSFVGNKLFSYKVGNGSNDTELGFPLSYRTIENSGDIVFDFNLLADTYTYDQLTDVITSSTDTAVLRKYTSRSSFNSVSGWTTASKKSEQWVVQQPEVKTRTNNFKIDVYDRSGDLTDLAIKVYVNNTRYTENDQYTIVKVNGFAYVTFSNNLTSGDKLVIKTNTSATKNEKGFYEFPINFEKNPQNENVTTFTLGEVLDHVSSIVDNNDEVTGTFPGVGNLRDVGQLSKYGLKFVKHSGPINLALYNLTNKDYDAIGAIRYAGLEYIKFKREFLRIANELGFDGVDKVHVDKILTTLNSTKTNQDSFYFSDMVPYGNDSLTTHNIDDPSETIFSLTRGIDFTTLNEYAVLPYLNNKLLTKDKDYSISTSGFLTLEIPVKANDVLDVYEFESTDGCWIPPTPTKLGLYPKYRPEAYLDDTYIYVTPESTGPYKIYGRDETTTDTSYKNKLGWFYPLYTSEEDAQNADRANGGTGMAHDHVFAGYNKIFYMPNSAMNHATADDNRFEEWPAAQPIIQGHDGSRWRCFGDYRDHLLLDLERRIYNNIKQPYNETILDIADFVETKGRQTQFGRYKVTKTMISDFNRWSETVGNPDYSTNTYFDRTNGFTFNYSKFADPNNNSLPGFWRAVYKDFYNTDRPHSHPWEILGLTEKPDWWEEVYGEAPYTRNNLILWEDLSKGIVKEPGKKIVYRNKFKNSLIYTYIPVDDQGNLLDPANCGLAKDGIDSTYSEPFVFGDEGPVETAWRRSSHYPFSLITAWALHQPAQFFGLAFDRSRIARNSAGQLVYTDTSKTIELDQLKFPNSSTDSSRVLTAGIVNYIQGYLAQNQTVQFSQYQTEIKSLQNKIGAKLGGFTQKDKFKLILDSRTPTNEGNIFVPEENYKINLVKSVPINVYTYSGVIIEIVPSGYIIRGYDKENPYFKTYSTIKKNADPLISVGGTSESFLAWTSRKFYEVGQIVELNEVYYRVKVSHTSGDNFNLDNFQKLAELPEEGGAKAFFRKNFDRTEVIEIPYGTLYREIQDVVDFILGYEQYLISVGFTFDSFNQDLEEVENWSLSAKEYMFWTTQNWESGTVLTLSPSARQVNFEEEYVVADDIYNNFYDYSLLKSDGKRLLADFATTERDNTNSFGIYVKNTEDGIYNLKVPVVQHEHVIILDNRTVFGDVIYNRPQGYRQERIKVKGYRSDDWNGSYNIPGFIFDDATVNEWQSYQDYSIGSLIKHKQYYYVAKANITGTEFFEDTNYVRLNEKPEQALLPNWDYKAKQFLDFYDLDSDNFDTEQQRLAQHLIGYQNRTYLENIINDDVSQFKFFQGAIQDKGTKNVLTKLFDKLGSASKDSLEFYEEWAVRVGRYGATTGDDQFEVLLDEEKYRLSPQPVELVEVVDPQDTSLVYRLDRNNILVKSQNYDHKPFPVKYFNDNNSYTKTAGYVNSSDVSMSLLNYDEILDKTLSEIPGNSYLWVALQKNQQTWAVYKHTQTEFKITSISDSNNTTFDITLNRAPNFEIGDIIGVNDVNDDVDKFYKISNISLNVVSLLTTDSITADDEISGYITEFKNTRLARLSEANSLIDSAKRFDIDNNSVASDIIWVDDDDTGKWIVLENNQVFELKPDIKNTLAGLFDSTQKDFGSNISVSNDNNLIAISAPKDLNGSVYIYQRPSDNTDFGYLQQIDEQTLISDQQGGFGSSVAMSPDKKYLAIGSPNASNVKTKFKGDYRSSNAYVANDIVLHDTQLWKAKRTIESELSRIFDTHASNQQSIEDDYDSTDQSYPEIPFMIRGDYSLGADESTDHILIRAETDQWEGTKAGDRLFLKWNKYTTTNKLGTQPFNNDSVLTETFINGEHTIVNKVSAICHVQSTLLVPEVGSEITTDVGKATVVYRKVNDENQMTLYLSNINGQIGDVGTFLQNGVTVGDYELVLPIRDDYHSGWWYINVGSTFTSSNLTETNANLVVQTIKLENDFSTPTPYFTNILDVVQNRDQTKPTQPSYLGVLSHTQGQTLIDIIDSRWYFRTELTHGSNVQVGDNANFWLNSIKVNDLVQDPSAINLSFDYLNNTQHTVDDIWDGWTEVRLTNFDLNGDPFLPLVGDTLSDTATGETAEIAFIERAFGTAKIYLKNRSGAWALGSDFGEPSNATFIQNDSTLRTIGPINSTHMQNSISGPIIVIDKAENIAIPSTNYIQDLEYWHYSVSAVQGIIDSTTPPSSINLDWTRVFNIPASPEGTQSGLTNEGMFAIYEFSGSTYQLINYFTVPNSASYRQLGTNMMFSQTNDNYRLFVHASGNNTELNQGRIYYFDKSDTENWSIGTEPNYRGLYRTSGTYFEGEYTKFGDTVYEAKTNLIPGIFNPSQWTEIGSGIDLLGYVPNDTNFSISESTLSQDMLEEFGSVFDVSNDGNVLIAAARYTNTQDSSVPNIKIVVYRKINDQYVYSQLLEPSDLTENFGEDIAISNDGKKIAVGASYNSNVSSANGAVYIYMQHGDSFVYNQTIRPKDVSPNTRFGARLDFDGNTLAVTAKGGDIVIATLVDSGSTTFDNNNTEFTTVDNNSGLVSVYETVNDTLLYGQDFSYDRDTEDFGNVIKVKNNHVYIGLPTQAVSTNNIVDRGVVSEFRKPANSTTWSITRSPVLPADLSKFKGVFLYNKNDNSLVSYVDYIDPIQGKIAGPAEQEISFKTSYDPARYSNSTTTSVVSNTLDFTSDKWIGKLWWDIGSARFINHHQGDIIQSTANFNKLFPGTQVDVYEWVETTLTPSEWDEQSGTESGLTNGISGTTKYGNTAYSVRRRYNSASQTFTNYYYYWVRNKQTLPNIDSNRVTTAFDVARYISDPAGINHKFVAILGDNRFSIYNCESLIQDKDIAISFNWWTIENQQQNVHNEYQLISDGLSTSTPNNEIEQKWFDSLVGFDTNDRPVPDINLPMKQRYGSLNEPRQSWFINKTEARKQFIERTNKVLSQNLIVDDFDLSGLTEFDPLPTVATGIFDTTSDSFAELSFVSIARVKPATLTLEIENGVIINVLITDPGEGYINSPTYVISDSQGTEGELEFTLDSNGKINNVNIINGGKNYSQNARISIRKFAVLVKNDENINGKWSVFQWDGSEWLRTLTQSYDVNLYWKYIDWYQTGYNQFTLINHLINSSYELFGLDDQIGEVVKIKSIGTGGWLLLRKVDNQDVTDYSINYQTIGRENGTIEFLDSLYDVNSENIAFDGANYDKIFYDTEPVEEFRKIISIIKNNIFVDQLQLHWNELFFAGLRYVFTEQPNVDWAFKTSFVKAKHNIGELAQKITFQNDSLPSYQDYVEEMKPYKTKIREYLSSYEKIDPANNVVTDFDLPPVYDELEGKIVPQSVQIINDEVVSGTSDLTVYPAKHWLDNVGFEITKINIASAGNGYVEAPIINITGGGGSGATAKAFIGNGQVVSIEVTNPGQGYLSQPTIEVIGSIEEGGSVARLSPVFGNGKVKSAHLRCKFDRVTGTYLFQTLEETETFTSSIDQLFIDLKWPMELKSTNITVTVDGLESLRSEYTFENVEDTSKGYTRYYGRINFTNALSLGRSVSIKYNKAPDLLQAQDRINLYYNPSTGMFGNELGQLLDGIDYGGVEVTSFDFGAGSGWDSDSWFTSTYDTFDTTYEDEIFQLDGSTEVFALSRPLEDGVEYNIYLNGVKIDDPNFGDDDSSLVTNENAVIRSITGDGVTTTVTILNDVQRFKANDVVVIRKNTSDGSFLPDPRSYDTVLSGGNLQFSTAKGINPEEIIIDGDGFVTPTTSKGPEEQVPGQVLDTVDIKVFHRPEEGGSTLSSNTYRANGTRDTFAFGIQPQNKEGLIVKLDENIQRQSLYTVDYKNKTVKFNTVPSINATINIVSISGNGKNVLEQSETIGDGSSISYVTKARYTSTLDYYATVNGVAVESVLVSSDDGSTEDSNPKATILFGSPPPDNSVISYAIYSAVDSFSKIETTEFIGDGSTKTFDLETTPYSALPNSHNVIVKQGNRILNPGFNQQYNITASQREYFLEIWQSPIGSFDTSDVLVLINGVEQTIAVDYNIRPANSSIILEPGIGADGDILEVYLRTDGDYAFGSIQIVNNQNTWIDSGSTLQLDSAPPEGEILTVYTFNKHDDMDFERINYDVVARTTLVVGSEDDIQYNHIKGGLVKLRYAAVDAQYVWLTVNGLLQTPSVDYILTDDKQYLRYKGSFADNDVVELIQFSSLGPLTPKFGFSQFKDILNRNIYKRLGDVAPLKLARDLNTFDKEIILEDASTISAPDKNSKVPGIIFINGERIEYLIKQENTLRQIQRGTLGTGVPQTHLSGSDVYNAASTQTAPYADNTIVDEIDGDGSTFVFELGFTPASVNEFEVFVAGRRLRKNEIQVFDATLDQDSPEGDVTAPAEFSVDGITPFVTLLNKPADGTKIKIVRRQGTLWTDPGTPLNNSESLVARFFKAEKVELPK